MVTASALAPVTVASSPASGRTATKRAERTDGRTVRVDGSLTCSYHELATIPQSVQCIPPTRHFGTKPRDRLGRTSPKSFVLCRVGRKTLAQ